MYPQGEYPSGDQPSQPPSEPGPYYPLGPVAEPTPPADQELFTQLYHGGQAPDADAEAEAEAEHKRRTQGIVAANSSVAVSAATGSAAASAVILAGQSGGAAGVGGAGAGGAAGSSLASGGTVAGLVKGGLGMKFLIGGIAGAVVVSGVVVGVTVINRDSVGNDAAPMQEAALDKGIEEYDFENTAFVGEGGTEYQLTDGHYQPPDVPGDAEGYFLTGTEFADADGDNDVDAATLLEWRPNAGHTTTTVILWQWDGEKPVQIEQAVSNGYYGGVGELKAVDGGFSIESTLAPPDITSENDAVVETITIGVKDGFPVQTEPVFGGVDRCSEFRDYPATGPYPDVIPKVAPSDSAPDVGKAADIESVYVVYTERSEAMAGSGWMIARVERTDGEISCGWIPQDTPF